MKILILERILVFCLVATAFATLASGQTSATPDPAKPQPQQKPPQKQDLLRELSLTPDQFQQIRRLNAERKPRMDEAQKRLKESNQALDEAIYSDQVSDQDFQDKLKAFQQAQAEVVRIRFHGELAVRKILTPDQLSKFRELRRKFDERRETQQQNQRPRQDVPKQMRPVTGPRRQPANFCFSFRK